MRTSLLRIKDWPERAAEARYGESRLATICGVGVRQLERFFCEHKQVCPKTWLQQLRDDRAIELLKESFTVKEVAWTLGCRDASHFSRDFQRRHGMAPSKFISSSPEMSRFDMRSCF